MPQHYQAKLDGIILLATLKSEDLKLCTPNAVLKVIYDELLDLWKNGIKFVHNNEELNVKIVLAQVCGDNLGLHYLLGFSEGFNANWPCRSCKMHKKDCQTSVLADKSKTRNKDNFELDIGRNNLSEIGLNFESILNKLPYFHVTKNYVFDIMHDLFEGVAPDLFKLVIMHLIESGKLTLDKLNHRLESYDFGRHYSKSRPSQIKLSFMKGETKAGQNASQNLCLILYFPLLVGDLVDDGDKIWSLFLLFQEIVCILLSNNITKGGVLILESLISEFLHSYQVLFKKPLKPKHHHMVHYAHAISQIGPLRQFWSMTFEARHKFFKTVAHTMGNFKNIPKSLAYRFQLSRCFKLLATETFSQDSFTTSEIEIVKLSQISDNNIVGERLMKKSSDEISIVDKITRNGSIFEIGSFALLEYDTQSSVFGSIKSIIIDDDECYFLVAKYNSSFNAKIGCFELEESTDIELVNYDVIKYFQCFYSSISFDNDLKQFIMLPVKYI